MTQTPTHIVMVGGSAGSFPLVMDLLRQIPSVLPFPMVLVLHRLRNVTSEMDALLSRHSGHFQVTEPEDKEPILNGHIYLAPQNYHLLIAPDGSFSLDASDPVNFSRPSIDISFETAARFFGTGCSGILLSGANRDGSAGISSILQRGGKAWIQEPDEASYPVMPATALAENPGAERASIKSLIQHIQTLSIPHYE